MYFPPCITCCSPLKDTLRPTNKQGYFACSVCDACYCVVEARDWLGYTVEYLDPVSPGKKEFSKTQDEVNYEASDNTSSTLPSEHSNDSNYFRIPPPAIEYFPSFDEELDIIDKSNTVKEFLKNSKYLEKPYDKE